MLKKKIDFKKKLTAMNKQHLNAYAESYKTMISDRTRRGISKDGSQFKGYKRETIQKKGSSIVNLTETGKMLRSIQYRFIKKNSQNILRYSIGGNRTGKLSNNDVAYYNKKMGREFLGFAKNELKEVKNVIRKAYLKALKI